MPGGSSADIRAASPVTHLNERAVFVGSTLGKQNIYADRTAWPLGSCQCSNKSCRSTGEPQPLPVSIHTETVQGGKIRQPVNCLQCLPGSPGMARDAHWIFPSIQALSAYGFVAGGRNCHCLDRPVRNRVWSVPCLVEGSYCNGCFVQICSSWSMAHTAPLAAFQPQAICLIKEFFLWHW